VPTHIFKQPANRSMDMLLAQITDLHVMPKGQLAYGRLTLPICCAAPWPISTVWIPDPMRL